MYAGIYRAKAISGLPDVTIVIPQVFGDVKVPLLNALKDLPAAGARGWVIFESGQAESPVWMS